MRSSLLILDLKGDKLQDSGKEEDKTSARSWYE